MRKVARLDQILLDLGYVNEAQIEEAVQRQQELGRRFGMTLVEMGLIDENQLLTALAEQFRLPILVPEEDELSHELAARMPPGLVEGGFAIPLSWNQVQGVLSVAMADPGDTEIMARLKEAFEARGVRVAVAPERVLKALGQRLQGAVGRKQPDGGARRGVSLPELFGWDMDEGESAVQDPGPAAARPALLVSASAAKKNFLPPLLKTEAWSLHTASSLDEVRQALDRADWDAVIVSEEMEGAFSGWVDEGLIPRPPCEVVALAGVGDALLANPVPYDATMACLQQAVHALADARCAALGTSAPYGLVARDLQVLGQAAGLPRVVRDALDVAAHLLLPGDKDPFDDFVASLELAAHLRFPWRLDSLLAVCHDLCTGKVRADGAEDEAATGDDETLLAAQILALVWFRHNYLAGRTEGTDPDVALRAGLKKVTGRLASNELVELYLRTLADRGGEVDDASVGPVLLVGGDRIQRALVPALKRIGLEPTSVPDLAKAQDLAERGAASALVVDYDDFPDRVHQFARVTKLGGRVLFFVIADADDPSLVLNLLDAGVDDVFVAGQDHGLIAARVNRALRSRRRTPAGPDGESSGFAASFEVFSFLDLIQMLGHGRKSVRIEMMNDGSSATLVMREGTLIHAVLGDETGEEAVYGVIAWEDRGEFTVHQAEDFPEATIAASTESVLMEGCRLLDEAKRDALV